MNKCKTQKKGLIIFHTRLLLLAAAPSDRVQNLVKNRPLLPVGETVARAIKSLVFASPARTFGPATPISELTGGRREVQKSVGGGGRVTPEPSQNTKRVNDFFLKESFVHLHSRAQKR